VLLEADSAARSDGHALTIAGLQSSLRRRVPAIARAAAAGGSGENIAAAG
jgi:hypothetical protein